MSSPPRPLGRPPIGPEVRGLRLHATTLTEMEALAAQWGVPRAEAIRVLVEYALADQGIRVLAGTVIAVRTAARGRVNP